MDLTDAYGRDEPGQGDGNERITRELIRVLDAETSTLDPRLAARLARSRCTALASGGQPVFRRFARPARPRLALTGMAMAGVLASFIAVQPLLDGERAPVNAADTVALDELPVLSASDAIEFYESIDFLVWLDERRA